MDVNQTNKDLLRRIPKVDELVGCPQLEEENTQAAVTVAVREELAGLRGAILSGACDSLPDREELIERIKQRIRRNATPNLRRLINATGVILHTNLGRAPLAKSAVRAVGDAAAGYSNLEYEVAEGVRGSRHSHVENLLVRLTGAEAAMVVNNNAAAVLLLLSALAAGKEVVVSRGELVEIGGAFRIPEVMEQSGCILREVGATNRTRAADYERAIDPERTGALLKAHTSNFRIVGFTEEVSIPEMAALGKNHNLPVLYDLGGGAMLPLTPYGIRDEPGVAESVAEGADVVTFSGDKLLGGPQAGILVGKKDLIARMKKHPLARAVRIDKLTLAALEATLRLYLDPAIAAEEIPTLRMLGETRESLREKAERLMKQLEPAGDQARVVEAEGQVGGGSVPGQLLASAAVEVLPRNKSVAQLEQELRTQEIPIIARISHDRLLLDVRTIEEEDFPCVAESLLQLLDDGNGGKGGRGE